MILLTTWLAPLALISVAAADIISNIPQVRIYAASHKYPYTQLAYQYGGVFASITGTGVDAFNIVCSPETHNTTDPFGSTSRVLCSNGNIGNPNKEKYVLYIKGPIGAGAPPFQQVGLASLDAVPAISVDKFVFGPGPQLYYAGPEVNGHRTNTFFSMPNGLIMWAAKSDYKLKKDEEWLAISTRDNPPWLSS